MHLRKMRIVQKGGQMQASLEIRQGDAPDPVSTGAPCELHDPVFGTPDRRTRRRGTRALPKSQRNDNGRRNPLHCKGLPAAVQLPR
jgi:hypothetical protein